MRRPHSVQRADRRPSLADVATIAVESVDAAGELTLVAHEGGRALAHLGPGRAANADRARADAWAVDPRCVVCEQAIPAVDLAGLVETPDGARVACKRPCWVVALKRYVLVPLIPSATRAGAR